MYDVEKEIFSELDDRGRRGYDHKLFKTEFMISSIWISTATLLPWLFLTLGLLAHESLGDFVSV